jgi:hypothetical protein
VHVLHKYVSILNSVTVEYLQYRFVDRDMFMRFRGGGIGHKSFQKEIRKFFDDRWPNELREIKNRAGTGNSKVRMDVKEDLVVPEQTLMQQPTI